MNNPKICAIVVTYNRKNLLEKCLKALLGGVKVPDYILVVDNASTDGTKEHIENTFSYDMENGRLIYMCLPENMGGAGGFHEGLKKALSLPVDAFWLMDDDAEVDPDALSELMKYFKHDRCVAPLPTDKKKQELAWLIMLRINGKKILFDHLSDIPEGIPLKAQSTGFLGLLVPRQIVQRIGLPIKDYFIWIDDFEYTSRIWEAGFSIEYVRGSFIYHPVQRKVRVNFLWRKNFPIVDAPDWKQYYWLRNIIHMLSRRGRFLDIIRSIVLSFLVWKVRGARKETLHYYLEGLWDGLRGRLGKKYLG
ncbi:MAG: glycosyltransferase family 2 protein [Thermodesulforhabdaceae bacterium]|jgi:GT2 family glycosyltransferase